MIGCEDRWDVEARRVGTPPVAARCTVHGTLVHALDEYGARALLREACLSVDPLISEQ